MVCNIRATVSAAARRPHRRRRRIRRRRTRVDQAVGDRWIALDRRRRLEECPSAVVVRSVECGQTLSAGRAVPAVSVVHPVCQHNAHIMAQVQAPPRGGQAVAAFRSAGQQALVGRARLDALDGPEYGHFVCGLLPLRKLRGQPFIVRSTSATAAVPSVQASLVSFVPNWRAASNAKSFATPTAIGHLPLSRSSSTS